MVNGRNWNQMILQLINAISKLINSGNEFKSENSTHLRSRILPKLWVSAIALSLIWAGIAFFIISTSRNYGIGFLVAIGFTPLAILLIGRIWIEWLIAPEKSQDTLAGMNNENGSQEAGQLAFSPEDFVQLSVAHDNQFWRDSMALLKELFPLTPIEAIYIANTLEYRQSIDVVESILNLFLSRTSKIGMNLDQSITESDLHICAQNLNFDFSGEDKQFLTLSREKKIAFLIGYLALNMKNGFKIPA